ncbi:MAG: hypothetical protein Q9167_001726, partial [Letrouitia subvulpina]
RTTHLLLRGSLTIAFPDDKKDNKDKGGGAEKRTYTAGDRVDVAAGQVHEVWMGGEEGCEYVIGE